MTPEQILALWREAGGDTHGPIVETATIPLDYLPQFVEAVRAEQQSVAAARPLGLGIFCTAARAELKEQCPEVPDRALHYLNYAIRQAYDLGASPQPAPAEVPEAVPIPREVHSLVARLVDQWQHAKLVPIVPSREAVGQSLDRLEEIFNQRVGESWTDHKLSPAPAAVPGVPNE